MSGLVINTHKIYTQIHTCILGGVDKAYIMELAISSGRRTYDLHSHIHKNTFLLRTYHTYTIPLNSHQRNSAHTDYTFSHAFLYYVSSGRMNS